MFLHTDKYLRRDEINAPVLDYCGSAFPVRPKFGFNGFENRLKLQWIAFETGKEGFCYFFWIYSILNQSR